MCKNNALILSLALSLSLSSLLAAAQVPAGGGAKPAQCRQAVDTGLEMARQLPAPNPRELERKNALLSRLQSLVSENRKKHLDECQTWAEFNRIATQQ